MVTIYSSLFNLFLCVYEETKGDGERKARKFQRYACIYTFLSVLLFNKVNNVTIRNLKSLTDQK